MFNRFADDHLKRWKDEHSEYIANHPIPFPELGELVDEDARIGALRLPPKPQYKVSITFYHLNLFRRASN